VVLVCLWLTACMGNPYEIEIRQVEPVVQQDVLVGDVALRVAEIAPAEDRLLDVGIEIFAAAPVDPDTAQIAPWLMEEIRLKETHFLPSVLRNTLVESNQWGAVRVLPRNDPSVDIRISGTVLHSDGLNQVLAIRAVDSAGRVWLDKTYSDESGNQDYLSYRIFPGEDAETATDPFADLYAAVVNDLLAVRDSLNAEQLVNIRQVSRMRYASDLSPDTFERTLVPGEDGLLRLTSLLAEDDPMLRRLGDIRARHHVFIDTLDEYYLSLYDEMQPLYDMWRSYSRDEIMETRERLSGGLNASGGSRINALTQSYDRYKWARIYEQEFAGLAQGFNNEVAPAILELNRRVHGLSGPVEEQYDQWRDILRQLFEVESGQESAAAGL